MGRDVELLVFLRPRLFLLVRNGTEDVRARWCTRHSSTREAETGGLQVPDQPWLHSKTCLKKKRKREKREKEKREKNYFLLNIHRQRTSDNASFLIFYLLCVCVLCVHMHCTHTNHSLYVKVRGQLSHVCTHTNHSSPSRSEISSLLPSIFWRSNLTCQAWQRAPSSTMPSHCPQWGAFSSFLSPAFKEPRSQSGAHCTQETALCLPTRDPMS